MSRRRIRDHRVRATWPASTRTPSPPRSTAAGSWPRPGGSRAPTFAADYGAEVEESTEALLARPDVDVAIIATPHSTHLNLARGGGRGRQARLPREADGARCRGMRPDHRRLPEGRRPADDRQADPLHADVDEGEGADRRRRDRRAPLHPADEPDRGPRDRGREPLVGEAAERATASSTGARIAATRCAGSRAATRAGSTPTWTTSRACPRRVRPPPSRSGWPTASSPRSSCATRSRRPAIGTNSNNQYFFMGSKGMVEFDLDHVSIGRGESWKTVWELPTWINPLQPSNPRRIGNSAPPGPGVHRLAAGGAAPEDHRRGRPGRDRDEPGGHPVREHRAGGRPAAGGLSRWPRATSGSASRSRSTRRRSRRSGRSRPGSTSGRPSDTTRPRSTR